MKKLTGLIKLLRFDLSVSAGICVIMGQLFALGELATLHITLFGFFAIFSISSSILVMNDYFDVETDKINAPERAIPSGLVTPNEALLFSIALLITGFVLSYLLSLPTLLLAVISALIGFLYNRVFKKSGIVGNLMVSFSVGMTFIFGGVSVGLPFNKTVWFFGLIAALIDLGEEIAADAMDMKGDVLINSNSIAIKHGRNTALKVSSYIFLKVIILSIIPFILGWFTLIYLIPIAIMDFAIGYSTLKLTKARDEEGRKLIKQIYLGSTFGLIIFLLMRLFGV